ncbi:conserved hypothetical protein [Sporisorium reilianum SRZ2]|uniref:DUF3752 domain-containing protein n=1 Tax=Sporisorium reilianum (strain SRZ2) TaxID=999809 RepID=E7A3E7_SPORE|nr:conserved hypothetical protein [Sporisorium reilianum SRZ2]
MAAIGPQLPPGLERAASRRSRSRSASASGSSRSSYASSSRSASPSGSDVSSRQRPSRAVAGPQLPAGFLRARSDSASSSRSRTVSSDDDGRGPSVGPALPSGGTTRNDGLSDGAKLFLEREARRKAAEEEAQLAAEKAANSRPEWMLLPPSLSNASSLQAVAGDPLNLKSRGFAQSTPRVSARGGGGANAEDADMSVWTETPEERLKRMQDEVSGVGGRGASAVSDREALEKERSARRDSSIAAVVAGERSGKKSLVEEHNERRRRELRDKLEGDAKHERSREKRRRHDDQDRRSSRHSRSDRHSHRSRHRSRSRSKSPDARHKDRDRHRHHRSSRRDDSHRSHASSRRRRHSDSPDDARRRSSSKKESDHRREKDERKSTKSRKEREEEEVRSGKAAAPMIWDRDAALSVGGRLMDEKKRGKMMADANALGDRFGSGSRRFL